jgi:hypothetical protein
MVFVDVKGAFLHGELEEGEIIHMKIPQGFEKHFPEGSVLLLLKCLYGLKQVAKAFWRQLLRAASATPASGFFLMHGFTKLESTRHKDKRKGKPPPPGA